MDLGEKKRPRQDGTQHPARLCFAEIVRAKAEDARVTARSGRICTDLREREKQVNVRVAFLGDYIFTIYHAKNTTLIVR